MNLKYIFSDTRTEHVPISSVKLSEVHSSAISGLCSSPEGYVFMLDTGLSRIYRLDVGNGDCITIAKTDNALDIAFFGAFVVVLLNNALLLLDSDGAVLKKFSTEFPSPPVSVCATHASIIVIGQEADITNFKIDLL